MKVFKIETVTDSSDFPKYEGTLDAVKATVRNTVGKHLWPETTVTEVNVATDKGGVIAMLNGAPELGSAFRTWGVTNRGALKEEK